MPPRKKRTVTVHSSSDHENDQQNPVLKSVEKRKPNSRKSADPQDQDGLPSKKPRGRPRKSPVGEGDGDLSAKKPKKKPRKRIDDEEEDDEQPAKKQKYKAHEPTDGGELQEIFLSQLPQDGSSSPPWRIRGPIWQKQQPPPKPAVLYKPPQPPVFYKPPVSYKPPQPPVSYKPHQSNPQPANARQAQQQPQQNPSRSPIRNGLHGVTATLPTAEARQRHISNPVPFYSSPFTPPKNLQNSSLQARSPSRSPSRKANTKAPREATHIPSPSPPMDAGADVELDPADFPSSLSSPSHQVADKEDVAITLPATPLRGPPVTLNPNDFSSSPPSPPKPASNHDEFDDDDLDDIDESLFQRLVSRPPIDKPAKQAQPVA